MSDRIFLKITHETLPQVREKYPFIYLEHGRLEVDDSSVKWIDALGNVVKLPIASISTLLLGTGTTVTHAAIKSCSKANSTVCWVGEDSLLFYAVGQAPTATSKNFRKQMLLATDKLKAEKVQETCFYFVSHHLRWKIKI